MSDSAFGEDTSLAVAARVRWVGYYLNQLASRIRTATSAALEPVGLTPPQFRALETIGSEQPLTQARLGELTTTDRTTVVAIVDRLEDMGAVERRRDEKDRRSHALILTAAGDRLLNEARLLAQAAEDAFLTPLSEAERSSLRALLIKLHLPQDCEREKNA
jgi:DNA-binding MarR family transcriptional regulator